MIYRKTLGPVSARLISSLYAQSKYIFTLNDVMSITGLRNTKAADLTSELVKRGIIARLKYGKYVIIPQELGEDVDYIGNWYVVAREIANSPYYYISHYSAMDIHNMLTHPVTKVFMTTPKQEHEKQRIVGNTTFEFIYISEKNIWGVKNIWITKSEQVRVSDGERTILDCLYQPKYCGGIMEIVKGMWIQKEKIDYEMLFNYALKYNKIVVIKRLGYILESLDLQGPKYLNRLRMKLNNKYYKFEPLLSTEVKYKNSWKLIANISPDEMRKNVST